jgi:hypothetical protein
MLYIPVVSKFFLDPESFAQSHPLIYGEACEKALAVDDQFRVDPFYRISKNKPCVCQKGEPEHLIFLEVSFAFGSSWIVVPDDENIPKPFEFQDLRTSRRYFRVPPNLVLVPGRRADPR